MLAKLQQTRSMQQAILSFTIEKMAIHQKPQHRITKAILKNLFKKFLGNLKMSLTTQSNLVETFSEKERENLVKLYQEGHLTDEQLRAFGLVRSISLKPLGSVKRTRFISTNRAKYSWSSKKITLSTSLQIQKCFILTKKKPSSLLRRGLCFT